MRLKCYQQIMFAAGLLLGSFATNGYAQETKIVPINSWCGNGQRIEVPLQAGQYVTNMILTLTQANGDLNATRVRVNGKESGLLIVPFIPARPIDPDFPIQVNDEVSSIILYCEGTASAFVKDVQIFGVGTSQTPKSWNNVHGTTTAQLATELVQVIRSLQGDMLSAMEFEQFFKPIKILAAQVSASGVARGDAASRTSDLTQQLVDEIQKTNSMIESLMARDGAFDRMTFILIVREKLSFRYSKNP